MTLDDRRPKVRVEYKIFIDGELRPEIEGYIRIPFPEAHTLEDVLIEAAERACRQLHYEKREYR